MVPTNRIRQEDGKSLKKLLVIDEISMISPDALNFIHRRLEEIAGLLPGQSLFGNVSILAVGDLFQLKPVGASPIFGQPKDDHAKLAGSLWKENFQFMELTQTMRQQNDQPFAELLNRVRTEECTKEDIETLKSRQIAPDDPNYPREALHAFPTNAAVDEHNDEMLVSTCTGICTLVAIDAERDIQTGQAKMSDSSGSESLPTILKVAVGARVMLLRNVDVQDGLCNGARGNIEEIIRRPNGTSA